MRPYVHALAVSAVALTALVAAPTRLLAADSGRQQPAPRHPETPQVDATAGTDEPVVSTPTLAGETAGGAAGPAVGAIDPAAAEAIAADLALREARNTELEARRLAGEEEVARLAADLAKGQTPEQELELHRRIARAKEDAQLDLFTIQAKYARLAGFEETALEIEAMVKVRQEARDGIAPAAAVSVPVVRPRPAAQKRGE
jgi:hypothetical protein